MRKAFFAVAVLLFATIGAVASVKLIRMQVFFYDNHGLCVMGWVEETFCPIGQVPDCIEIIYDVPVGGTPVASQPIYSGVEPLNPLHCICPYDRP